MFYIRYRTMHKVHMHAGAVRQLLYGCAHVREIIHSNYLPVHTHKPYNYLHLNLFEKVSIEKKNQHLTKNMQNYPACRVNFHLMEGAETPFEKQQHQLEIN